MDYSRKQCESYTKKKPPALSEVMLRAHQTSTLQAVDENIAKHKGKHTRRVLGKQCKHLPKKCINILQVTT